MGAGRCPFFALRAHLLPQQGLAERLLWTRCWGAGCWGRSEWEHGPCSHAAYNRHRDARGLRAWACPTVIAPRGQGCGGLGRGRPGPFHVTWLGRSYTGGREPPEGRWLQHRRCRGHSGLCLWVEDREGGECGGDLEKKGVLLQGLELSEVGWKDQSSCCVGGARLGRGCVMVTVQWEVEGWAVLQTSWSGSGEDRGGPQAFYTLCHWTQGWAQVQQAGVRAGGAPPCPGPGLWGEAWPETRVGP